MCVCVCASVNTDNIKTVYGNVALIRVNESYGSSSPLCLYKL